MKKLLTIALLVAAVTQSAYGRLGPNGEQQLIGKHGEKISCKVGEKLYVSGNKVRCIKKGSMGATHESTMGKLESSNLYGPNGQQIKCKKGQRVYVGSNGIVSCIKSGLMGSTKRSMK